MGKDGDRQCPADLSPTLHERIDAMVKEAHRVLKCRHYSLYDLRIDASEQPYILEAALFCSFSPLSVIPSMAQHAGREDLKHPNLFHGLLERAAAEKPSRLAAAAAGAAVTASGELANAPTSDTLAGLTRDVSDGKSAESELSMDSVSS